MKNKILIASGVLAALLLISLIVVIVNKDETVIFSGKEVENEEAWNEFKNKALDEKKCKIKIKIGDDDKTKRSLEFNGEKYIYKNGKKTIENLFLVDVSGKAKNVDTDQRYIVLAGHDFSFDEIMTVLYSGEKEENLPFYIIHCY